jgi:hypothetical protein
LRGSEHEKADEERRMQLLLTDCVLLRFKAGESRDAIAKRYAIELWLVDNILRDHIAC